MYENMTRIMSTYLYHEIVGRGSPDAAQFSVVGSPFGTMIDFGSSVIFGGEPTEI